MFVTDFEALQKATRKIDNISHILRKNLKFHEKRGIFDLARSSDRIKESVILSKCRYSMYLICGKRIRLLEIEQFSQNGPEK